MNLWPKVHGGGRGEPLPKVQGEEGRVNLRQKVGGELLAAA